MEVMCAHEDSAAGKIKLDERLNELRKRYGDQHVDTACRIQRTSADTLELGSLANEPRRLEMSDNELLRAALKASMLLANEPTPQEVDVVYIHGLTKGMVEGQGILKRGADLGKQHRCPIAFNGSDGAAFATPEEPGSAWPGADYYVERLAALGISSDTLFPTGPGLHTRQEADEFAKLAKEKGWQRVMIVSVGYGAVRCMCCHVAAMYAIDHPFSAYFAQPREVDWDYPMGSSQGLKETTARDEIADEINRIIVGWERGADEAWRESYSAPPDMLFQYLKERDQSTLF